MTASGSRGDSADPTVQHLKALNLPLTFQNYIDKRFGDQTWDAGLVASFPKELQVEACAVVHDRMRARVHAARRAAKVAQDWNAARSRPHVDGKYQSTESANEASAPGIESSDPNETRHASPEEFDQLTPAGIEFLREMGFL